MDQDDETATLSVSGTPPTNTSLQLCRGLNLVGYPLAEPLPITSVLAPIAGKFSRVYGYDATNASDPWQIYDVAVPSWADTLQTLQPGHGYFILATEDTTLALTEVSAPSASFSGITDGATITEPTAINGTVSSSSLASWRLEYRLQGDLSFTTFATGSTPVTNARLGSFDPTLLLNGLYEVWLVVTDNTGQSAISSASGIVVEDIRRSATSRSRTATSRFRWREFQSRSSVPTTAVTSGPATSASGAPDQVTIGFRALAGTTSSLSIRGDNTALVLGAFPGTVTLVDSAFSPFDPSQYQLTFADGRQFNIDEFAGLQNITDVNGTRNEYDAAGRLTAIIDSDGNRTTLTHDLSARQEVVTDRLGNATVVAYDARGNVLQHTDPLGKTSSFTYDATDNQLSETDALGHTTTFSYDASSNLLSFTDPLGNTGRYTYNAQTLPLTVTDPLGRQLSLAYDNRGNLVAETDELGNVVRHTYDSRGNLLSTTDAAGSMTTFEYDANGNQVRVTDPLGVVASRTFDANNK
jgi:YD repeat-containing protein